MTQKSAIFFVFILTALATIFIINKRESGTSLSQESISPTTSLNSPSGALKTYKFDNFHGSKNIQGKFQFQYPANWHNDGQYFSPQKIEHYNLFTTKAPIYFDLVLSEVFHLTELQYQIDNSKRRSPDTVGQIGDKEFKKYDLTDYGSYGGDSAGRVKIFVGPQITIDDKAYTLVFHWEEKPLAEHVPLNSIDVFDNMLLTLKFID